MRVRALSACDNALRARPTRVWVMMMMMMMMMIMRRRRMLTIRMRMMKVGMMVIGHDDGGGKGSWKFSPPVKLVISNNQSMQRFRSVLCCSPNQLPEVSIAWSQAGRICKTWSLFEIYHLFGACSLYHLLAFLQVLSVCSWDPLWIQLQLRNILEPGHSELWLRSKRGMSPRWPVFPRCCRPDGSVLLW